MAGLTAANAKLAMYLVAGMSIGGAGAGYVIKDDSGKPLIQSLFSPTKAPTQALEETPDDDTQEQNDQLAAVPKSGSPSQDGLQVEQPAIETVEPELVVPSFDLLRVERDGSVVVAGRAPARSDVEILSGGAVLGAGKAGPEGDFAIVFDNPLAPGAHELTIRAKPTITQADSIEPLLSSETGIVTVPEKDNTSDDVLVMVQEPGAASRILQAPAAEEVSQPAANEEVEIAAAEPEVAPVEQSGELILEPDTDEVVDADKADQQQIETAVDDPVSADEAPSDTQALASSEPLVEPEDTVKVVTAALSVQAVDVEPEKVFIAGTGTPGTRVQVYINNGFKGAATIGPNGGFLFEMEEGLASGRHDLRVDEVDTAGAVKGRVAVVIDHTENQPTAPDQSRQVVETGTQFETDEPTSAKTEPDPTANIETVVATAEETVSVAANAETAEPSSDLARNPSRTDVAVAEDEPVAEEPIAEERVAGESPAQGEAVLQNPSTTEPEPTAPDEPVVAAKAEEPAAAEEPNVKVIETGKSVIIRRGDNLWRISRRMLGQGRKYTVIFEANANIIKDPNVIFPGQVFDVPDQAEGDNQQRQGDAG